MIGNQISGRAHFNLPIILVTFESSCRWKALWTTFDTHLLKQGVKCKNVGLSPLFLLGMVSFPNLWPAPLLNKLRLHHFDLVLSFSPNLVKTHSLTFKNTTQADIQRAVFSSLREKLLTGYITIVRSLSSSSILSI